MRTLRGWFTFAFSTVILTVMLAGAASAEETAKGLKVGDKAPDFALKTLDDKTVKLTDLTKDQPVVLIVLRGWPGYQCPACTTQVQKFLKVADGFATCNAKVVMVYPGPAENLKAHADDFLKNTAWPKDFIFVLDPDYTFTKAYNLRWDAPKETAYPSTFVIDQKGTVKFSKVSTTHGDRAETAPVLKALQDIK